ncbi:MAG: PilZ domain-containing protein [Myxococcota bacterium]
MTEESKSTTGTLLLDTGDLPISVVQRTREGMRIRAGASAQVHGTVRLAFQFHGEHAGLVRMLTAVDDKVERADGGMDLDLRYLALHSTAGKACVEEFLEAVLGFEQIDPASFKEGAGGWFYGFRATRGTRREGPVTARRRGGITVESQRREKRVAVRVPVVFKIGEETYRGHAYNVSYSGLCVLSDEVLPDERTEVTVAFPVALHARPFKIRLLGEVMWNMEGMTSAHGGGFGMRLNRVDDGAEGKAWREYVEREARFGGTATLG